MLPITCDRTDRAFRSFRVVFAAMALILGATLAGCTAAQQATVTTDVNKAVTDLQAAVNYYGIAKGVAQVAEIAEPALAPAINVAISVLDPLAASATQLASSTVTDTASAEALAQQITAQAVALTATAAPAIKVVASKT